MLLTNIWQKLKNKVRSEKFKLQNQGKERFTCPICNYQGPFMDFNLPTGLIEHSSCPSCRSEPRHRLQFLVMNNILKGVETSRPKMLHFAPEPFFREIFSKQFAQYETADFGMPGVDHQVDLQELPFEDRTYDFVFASHVLEHIPDDEKAISEIRRILKPNGIAILPVPLLAKNTIEYPEPNPNEGYHVRAPGFDYYDKYNKYFSKVDKISSDSFPSKYQLFIYEDRSQWPTKECPLRPPAKGERHIDIVPICYV